MPRSLYTFFSWGMEKMEIIYLWHSTLEPISGHLRMWITLQLLNSWKYRASNWLRFRWQPKSCMVCNTSMTITWLALRCMLFIRCYRRHLLALTTWDWWVRIVELRCSFMKLAMDFVEEHVCAITVNGTFRLHRSLCSDRLPIHFTFVRSSDAFKKLLNISRLIDRIPVICAKEFLEVWLRYLKSRNVNMRRRTYVSV